MWFRREARTTNTKQRTLRFSIRPPLFFARKEIQQKKKYQDSVTFRFFGGFHRRTSSSVVVSNHCAAQLWLWFLLGSVWAIIFLPFLRLAFRYRGYGTNHVAPRMRWEPRLFCRFQLQVGTQLQCLCVKVIFSQKVKRCGDRRGCWWCIHRASRWGHFSRFGVSMLHSVGFIFHIKLY